MLLNIFDNNKQAVHVISEIVTLVGITFYFNHQNKKLKHYIDDLTERLNDQETLLEKHDKLIRLLMNKRNPLKNINDDSEINEKPQSGTKLRADLRSASSAKIREEGESKKDERKEGESKEDERKEGESKEDERKEDESKEGESNEGESKEGESKEKSISGTRESDDSHLRIGVEAEQHHEGEIKIEELEDEDEDNLDLELQTELNELN